MKNASLAERVKNETNEEEKDERLSMKQLRESIRDLHPSSIKDIATKVEKTPWKAIGGVTEAKNSIREAVEWPLKYPESFKRMGIRPPQGILLYGPPGCAKTMCAKALATESGLNFLSVKGP